MPKQNQIVRSKKKKAQSLLQENRLPEALELYRQICQIDRLDADAWFSLGLINAMMGSIEETVDCCRRAVDIRPNFVEARFNLAKA